MCLDLPWPSSKLISNSNIDESQIENSYFISTIPSINQDLNRSLINNRMNKQKYFPSQEESKKFDLILKNMRQKHSQNQKFDKKEFKINHKLLQKSTIYNFFDSIHEFKIFSQKPIQFVCIVCFSILKEKFSESTNLTSHLRYHATEMDSRLLSWITEWDNSKASLKNTES